MKNKIIYLFVFTLLIILFSQDTQAQDFATGINPPILLIEAEAPASIQAPIILENQSDQNITYGIFLRPFKANFEKNGTPNYDPELVSEYEAFFEGVHVQHENEDVREINVGPRQSKEVVLNIEIEPDQPPIDRYFTVVFLSEALEPDSNTNFVGSRAGIGTNVLLSFEPKPEPTGRIASLNLPYFVSRGPIEIELEVANHNDYYVVSEGNVVISNSFGHIVGNLEFGPLSILANSNRLIGNNETDDKLVWSDKYPIGIYTVEANVALSEKGPLLVEKKTFIAFPIELAIILIALILILIWIIKKTRSRMSERD